MKYTVADVVFGIERNNMLWNPSKWENNEFGGGRDLVFERYSLRIVIENNTTEIYVFFNGVNEALPYLDYSFSFGESTPLNVVIAAVQAVVTDIESRH